MCLNQMLEKVSFSLGEPNCRGFAPATLNVEGVQAHLRLKETREGLLIEVCESLEVYATDKALQRTVASIRQQISPKQVFLNFPE